MDPYSRMVTTVLVFGMAAATAITITWIRSRASRPRTDRGELADMKARLERIEQAVDAIAIETERISEGQRFTTKLLSDKAKDPIAK